MFQNGDEVVIILDNEIKMGKVYDFKNGEYRVADGILEDGKFTFSAWVAENFVVSKSQLLEFSNRLVSQT